MAKQNKGATSDTMTDAPAEKTFNGRTFRKRERARLDGFLFTGTKDSPISGTVVGKLTAVVEGKATKANPDKPNKFLVFEIHGVEGSLMVSDKDEPDPYAPEKWEGLTLGVNQSAALESLASSDHVGEIVMLVFGGYKKNAKSGRTFRDIEYYLPE